MVERRKEYIWNKNLEKEDYDLDFRFMNVPELRRLYKERNLKNAHLKSKDKLVELLTNSQNSIYNSEDNNEIDYNKKNVKELKKLAKQRGLTRYNNLKKDELVKLHQDYDEDIKMIESEEDSEDEDSEEEDSEEEDSEEDSEEDNEEDSEIMKSNVLKVFKFDNKNIRTFGNNNNPWFVAKDICDVLDIKKIDSGVRNIPEKWKGTQILSTDGGPQKMTILNEAGVYKLIMRSNKPIAERFQEFVCEDILPSIRKTGSYTLENKYKFILENNRPLSQVFNITDKDKEAIELEKLFNWVKNTNCPIVYVAYIGEGLIKVGFSDSKFDERLAKHISCESKYQQFLVLDTFEVSGKPIEDILHNLLYKYRHTFGTQKEIYKPDSKLSEFIENIKQILDDNDYKLKYHKLEKENILLKLEINELKKLKN